MNKSNKNLLYAGVVIAALAYFFRDKSEVSTTDSTTSGGGPSVETSGGGPSVETSSGGTPATSGAALELVRDSAGTSYYSA